MILPAGNVAVLSKTDGEGFRGDRHDKLLLLRLFDENFWLLFTKIFGIYQIVCRPCQSCFGTGHKKACFRSSERYRVKAKQPEPCAGCTRHYGIFYQKSSYTSLNFLWFLNASYFHSSSYSAKIVTSI